MSLVWFLPGVLITMVGAVYPPAYAAVVLYVPLTAGLLRTATVAVAGNRPARSDFMAGAGEHPWRHLLLGVLQAALVAGAAVNVGAALAVGGILAAMTVVVACYVALAVCCLAVATWPVSLDPLRADRSTRRVLAVGAAVTLAHPFKVLALVLVVLALAVATVQTVVLGVVAPAFAALLTAHHVLPLADRLEPGLDARGSGGGFRVRRRR